MTLAHLHASFLGLLAKIKCRITPACTWLGEAHPQQLVWSITHNFLSDPKRVFMGKSLGKDGPEELLSIHPGAKGSQRMNHYYFFNQVTYPGVAAAQLSNITVALINMSHSLITFPNPLISCSSVPDVWLSQKCVKGDQMSIKSPCLPQPST